MITINDRLTYAGLWIYDELYSADVYGFRNMNSHSRNLTYYLLLALEKMALI
jgi:hypothetical protein